MNLNDLKFQSIMKIRNEITDTDVWKGKNLKKYLIIHHTASSPKTTFQGIINFFKRKDDISVHYTVGYNGEVAQLANENDRCWHCGVSQWNGDKNLNNCSIGIEVLSDGVSFTDRQRDTMLELCSMISKRNHIPVCNILRHADIAPKRKTDIGFNFYAKWGDWNGFQDAVLEYAMKHLK